MEGVLVLCDAVNTDPATGKINMLGGGWSVTGPQPTPAGLVGFIRVPWDEAKDLLRFRAELVDKDGTGVFLSSADKNEPVGFDGEVRVAGRPPEGDVAYGEPMHFSVGVPLAPMPLAPGHAYRWRLLVEGEEIASVGFAVRGQADASP